MASSLLHGAQNNHTPPTPPSLRAVTSLSSSGTLVRTERPCVQRHRRRRHRPGLGLGVIFRYLASPEGEPPPGDFHPINSRPCRAYTTPCSGRGPRAVVSERERIR